MRLLWMEQAQVNTILVLLLTIVAFKFAITDSLPKVGYNTLMDMFFLLNMSYMFFTVSKQRARLCKA